MTKKTKLPPKTAAAKAGSLKSKSAKAPAKSPPGTAVKAANIKNVVAPVATVKAKAAAKPAIKTEAAAVKPVVKLDKPVVSKAAPVQVAAPRAPQVTAPHAIVPRAPQATTQRAMPAEGAKPATEKLTSPVKAAVAKPTTPSSAAADDAKKPITSRHGFKTNELIVYPAHGVGRIIGIEEQEIAGISLELFVIEFEKDKMTLRVPTSKLASVGMRKLAEEGVLKKAMDTLKGKARIKRTMWSRRAQEYEAKINSGDLVAIAEVVRDLYRSDAQPEQSYSERQLYEAALDRMSREVAAVDRSDERGAMQRVTEVLAKSARGRRAAEVEETEAPEATDEGEVKAA